MKLKSVVSNLSLTAASVLLVLGIAEVASRYTVPISPGPSLLSMSGEPLSQSYMKAGSEYRIITPDFDAPTTITKDGYRAPSAKASPSTLFLGDSFTFAQGVKDDQAFPHLYCQEKQLACANLAVPGASTPYMVDRLEEFLKAKGWAPNNVYLFFFTGNDFSDNLWAAQQQKLGLSYEPVELSPEKEAAAKSDLPLHKQLIDKGLKYSNLLRVLYFKALPELRKSGDPEAQQAQMKQALAVTKTALERLDALSEEYAFNYRIFVLYSEPEARLEKYKATDKALQEISPSNIISLGELFSKNSQDYFFPSDGHFTESGNRLIADYLIKELK